MKQIESSLPTGVKRIYVANHHLYYSRVLLASVKTQHNVEVKEPPLLIGTYGFLNSQGTIGLMARNIKMIRAYTKSQFCSLGVHVV